MVEAVSLTNFAGIPSGPVALFMSRVLSVDSTSCSLRVSSVMSGSDVDNLGSSDWMSEVNTDAK